MWVQKMVTLFVVFIVLWPASLVSWTVRLANHIPLSSLRAPTHRVWCVWHTQAQEERSHVPVCLSVTMTITQQSVPVRVYGQLYVWFWYMHYYSFVEPSLRREGVCPLSEAPSVAIPHNYTFRVSLCAHLQCLNTFTGTQYVHGHYHSRQREPNLFFRLLAMTPPANLPGC